MAIPLYTITYKDIYSAEGAGDERTMTTKQDIDNANKVFDGMRNNISGAVMCRQCQTVYHEIADTEIIDIETNEPAFYCTVCEERL